MNSKRLTIAYITTANLSTVLKRTRLARDLIILRNLAEALLVSVQNLVPEELDLTLVAELVPEIF